jgi:hypothetical protein
MNTLGCAKSEIAAPAHWSRPGRFSCILWRLVGAVCCLVPVVNCSSTPPVVSIPTLESQLPPLPANRGRVLIYNTTNYSAFIYANDVELGSIDSWKDAGCTLSYFDLVPGTYTLRPVVRAFLGGFEGTGPAMMIEAGDVLYLEYLFPLVMGLSGSAASIELIDPRQIQSTSVTCKTLQ